MADLTPTLGRWEYRFVRGPHTPESVNALGAEGWEMVAVSDGLWFKRPVCQGDDGEDVS